MAAFYTHLFNGINSLNPNASLSDSGHTWTNMASGAAHAKFWNGRIYNDSTFVGRWITNATPPSANYYVEAVIRCITDIGLMGVFGRGDNASASNNFYVLILRGDTNVLELRKRVTGTETTLGSYSITPVPGTDYTIRLSMVGTAIKGYLDGVERISVTDSAITAAGFPGAIGDEGTPTTSLHMDSLIAEAAGALEASFSTGGAAAVDFVGDIINTNGAFTSSGVASFAGVGASLKTATFISDGSSSSSFAAYGVATQGAFNISGSSTFNATFFSVRQTKFTIAGRASTVLIGFDPSTAPPAKVVFSWINHVDAAGSILTASNEIGDGAVSNLTSPILGKRWRTSPSGWGQIDFGSNQTIGVLTLIFTRGGTFPAGTISHFLDAQGGTPGTGAAYVSGAITLSLAEGYGYHTIVLPQAVTARYWRFSLNVTNTSFVDVGRAWAGPAWTPRFSIQYGYEDSWRDLSRVTASARSGVEFVDVRPRQREMAFSTGSILSSEKEDVREMQRIVGISKQILFVKDPNNTDRDTVLGRLAATSPIRHRDLNLYDKAFVIRESL